MGPNVSLLSQRLHQSAWMMAGSHGQRHRHRYRTYRAVDWNEIESEVIGEQKQIRITLSGKALRQAQSLAATSWVASWSSWEGQVVVTVVVE